MITKDDVGKDLTHRFGGNGLAVVQFLPDEYARVAYVSKDGLQLQVLTAWTKFLEVTRVVVYDPLDGKHERGKSVERMLTPEQFKAARKLSDDLESGRMVIHRNRAVPA